MSKFYLTAKKSNQLSGQISVSGDKSISHRALILGAVAQGCTQIYNLLESDDVMHTLRAMQKLGATICKDNDKWCVFGLPNGTLLESNQALDFGNSGTGVRLTMGLVSSYAMVTHFKGDESLSNRPMDRVLIPLQQMGVQVYAEKSGQLPLSLRGPNMSTPITYELPVASAQVKSAILLAALNTAGITTIIENSPTRDHTERMLKAFGADIQIQKTSDNKTKIQLRGQIPLKATTIHVPNDPSSAAFLVVAALITSNSELLIKNVLINENRNGFITTLIEMGAHIELQNLRQSGGEDIADLYVKSSTLHGITVDSSRAPSMIDEYPILSIAAACANGKTEFLGLDELRVKESDRLSAIVDGLQLCGVDCEAHSNSLSIQGKSTIAGGQCVTSHADHRIAMSFLILGLRSDAPISVTDSHMIKTSFPEFVSLMQKIGANIDAQDDIVPFRRSH